MTQPKANSRQNHICKAGFETGVTLNNRHLQCHPEVNSVLRASTQTLRWIAEQGEKREENIGSAGGKRSRVSMQASSGLIVSSISVLPALVTSKACSHAAQCLPWIIETTLCPEKSSLLNSLPRHSDTLQPRRDSFTLTHRNTALLRPLGTRALSGPQSQRSLLCSTNTTLWPGSRSAEPNPSFGFSFYWGEMLSWLL